MTARNKKKNSKLEKMGITFLMLVLITSLFWPYAYAIKTPQPKQEYKKLNMLQYYSLGQLVSQTGGGSGSSSSGACANIVQTVSLNATEYKNLINVFNHSLIDGFGNLEREKQQEELDKADLSENPGVNDVKNQMIMTASGKPMMIFDTLQHSAAPATASTCYLNNIVTQGYMSYASKVDQNIRFCSEYGAGACENGRGDYGDIKKNGEKIKDLQDFTSKFYNDDGTLKSADDINWDDLSGEYSTLKSDAPSIKNWDDFKSECENSMSDCVNNLKNDFGNSVPMTDIRSKWNVVESNKTSIQLYHADDIIGLPTNLAQFVKALADLRPAEDIILVLNIAAGVASFTSVYNAYKAARIAKTLDTVDKFQDSAEAVKTYRRLGQKIKDLEDLKSTINNKYASADNALQNLRKAKEGGDATKIKNAEEAVSNIKKNMGWRDWVKFRKLEAEKESLSTGLARSGITTDADRMAVEQITKQLEQKSLKQILNGNGVIKVGEQTLKEGDVDKDILKIFKNLPSEKGQTTWMKFGDNEGFIKKTEEGYELIKGGKPVELIKGGKPVGKIADSVKPDDLINALKSEKGYTSASPEVKTTLDSIFKLETGDSSFTLNAGKIKSLVENDGKLTYGGKEVNVFNIGKRGMLSPYVRIGRFGTPGGSLASLRQIIKYEELAKWQKIGLQGILGYTNFLKLDLLQAYFVFALQYIDQQPAGFYELEALVFHLTPAKTITGEEESYVDIIRTSQTGLLLDEDIFPPGFYKNLMNFVGFDLDKVARQPQEAEIIRKKMINIGEIATVVDQETGATELTQSHKPINIIKTQNIGDAGNRWLINSMNPDSTIMYAFEDPRYYLTYLDKKYTAMGLVSNNVNISGMTRVKAGGDWAKYGAMSTFATSVLPNAKDVIMMGIVSGGFGATGGIESAGLRYLSAIVLAKASGYVMTQTIMDQQRYGNLVDINKAFESGNRCEEVKDREMDKISPLLWAKGGLAAANLGLSVADAALAPTGVGAAVSIVAQIIVGIADYLVSDAYTKAKEEGLSAMKNCYETQYSFLAWQGIPTTQEHITEVQKALNQAPIQSFLDKMGINLNAISPNMGKQIQELGNSIFDSTLDVVADPIRGKSLIRTLNTRIYQVHFDKDATFKWYAENNCSIQFCTETLDGNYKCMTKQGYTLVGPDGKTVLEGPQSMFMQWSNLDSYASIPQKVINIAQADEPLMIINNSDSGETTDWQNTCVKKEVANDIGVSLDTEGENKLSAIMGNLQTIVTPNAIIWFDGDEVAISTMAEKSCSDIKFRQAQTTRVPKGSIEILRNGKIKVLDQSGKAFGGDDCTFDIGSSGAISFDNGMIMKARGGNKAYNTINGKPVIHMVIRDLLDFQASDIDSIGIHSACDCIAGAQGVKCTTEDGKQGAFFGFKLQGELNTQDSDQMNNLLDDICFTEGTGQNNESFSLDGNQFCMTQADGTQKCYNITSIDDGGLETSDGGKWQIENGPTGPEWWYYNKNGEKQGNPIPIMWLNGLGGSMYNNPSTGKISIKNEFPFAINPSFHEYGALANGGFAVPGLPPWGGRSALSTSQNNNVEKKSVMAQLPGLPVNPYWMTVFMIALIASLLAIRVKYGKEEIVKVKRRRKK